MVAGQSGAIGVSVIPPTAKTLPHLLIPCGRDLAVLHFQHTAAACAKDRSCKQAFAYNPLTAEWMENGVIGQAGRASVLWSEDKESATILSLQMAAGPVKDLRSSSTKKMKIIIKSFVLIQFQMMRICSRVEAAIEKKMMMKQCFVLIQEIFKTWQDS